MYEASPNAYSAEISPWIILLFITLCSTATRESLVTIPNLEWPFPPLTCSSSEHSLSQSEVHPSNWSKSSFIPHPSNLISKSCWLKLQNLPMTGHCYTSDYHSIARLLIQATTISYPAGCNSQLTYSACFRPWVPQPLPSLYSTDLLKIKVLITSPSKECIYSTYLLVIFSYASQPSPPSSSALLKQG